MNYPCAPPAATTLTVSSKNSPKAVTSMRTLPKYTLSSRTMQRVRAVTDRSQMTFPPSASYATPSSKKVSDSRKRMRSWWGKYRLLRKNWGGFRREIESWCKERKRRMWRHSHQRYSKNTFSLKFKKWIKRSPRSTSSWLYLHSTLGERIARLSSVLAMNSKRYRIKY